MRLTQSLPKLFAVILLTLMALPPYTGSLCFGDDAHPVINEIYTRHSHGQGNEWVELFNPGSSAVNIDGWQLLTEVDGTLTLIAAPFVGTVLPPGGYLTVIIDGSLMADDEGLIILKDNSGAEIDRVVYGPNGAPVPANKRESIGRSPDGQDTGTDAEDFAVMPPTEGSNNIDAGATISGAVFLDSNVNGRREGSEHGVSDVTVTLTTGGSSTSTSTDMWGDYYFDGVVTPGIYTITETDPVGLISTNAVPGDGATKVDANTLQINNISEEDINNRRVFGGNLFGDVEPLYEVISVGGTVWEDIDCDGFVDENEPGLAGTVVSLSTGLTQTTASDGHFLLYGASNVRTITVTTTNPVDYVSSNAIPGGSEGRKVDNDTILVTVKKVPWEPYDPPGDCTDPNDCGYLSYDHSFLACLPAGYATISGTVFDDTNDNGVFEPPGDTGLPGVSLTVETNTSPPQFSIVTDANGDYSVTVEVGTQVRITSSSPGSDWCPTTLDSVVLQPPAAGDFPNNNFGYTDNFAGCCDGVQNGEETDIDCGGTVCNACGTGSACNADSDCLSGTCTAGQCD